MSIQESDPLAGYGIWNSAEIGQKDVVKSIYADYDPSDPYGEYDRDRPFELMHYLRDTPDQSRRISRFSSLDDAIVAGQLLSLLLPQEYDKDSDWHKSPMLEVWVRSGDRWDQKYDCEDKNGLAAALLDGLKRANAQFRDIENKFANYQERHRFCEVGIKESVAELGW